MCAFATPDGEVHAVKNVNFDIHEGECLGVVGESGSGKSQLFPGGLRASRRQRPRQGSVHIAGEEILGLSAQDSSTHCAARRSP